MTDQAPSASEIASPTSRRKFQFSLRFFLLATVVMAGVLVLGIKRAEECSDEAKIVEELQAAGVRIDKLPQPSTALKKIFGERFSKQTFSVSLWPDDLEHLDKLTELEKVETISVRGGENSDLTAFSNFQNLESLTLNGVWALKSLDGIEHLQNLKILELGDAVHVVTAKPLASLKKLEELRFFNHDGDTCSFEDLDEVLHEMPGLKSFIAYECPVKSLEAFSDCKNLEHLELWLDASGITSIEVLEDLPRFRSLDLSDPGEIEDWQTLGSMTELINLRVSGFPAESLEFLNKLKKLKSLDLMTSQQLLTQDGKSWGEALEPMLSLPQLEKLNISWREIEALDEQFSLERFSQLRELTIRSGYSRQVNLSRLSAIPSLKKLHLRTMSGLNSLDGIELLGSLKELRIHACSELSDIKSLKQLVSLEKVGIFACSKIPPPQITNLKTALPNAVIKAY